MEKQGDTVNSLIAELKKENGAGKVLAAIDGGGCPALLTGMSTVHKAHMAALIRT